MEVSASSTESLSDESLRDLSQLIERMTGIKTPETKKALVEGRLYKRVKALKFAGLKDYCDYLFSDEGMKNELREFINVITTNKTDFFREAKHFEILSNVVLPWFAKEKKNGSMNFWSAACSTGEEAYSIAMTVEKFRSSNDCPDYRILCSDISTRVLDAAWKGIYAAERIKDMDRATLKQYFMQGTGELREFFRVNPDLRKHLRFTYFNLVDFPYNTGMFDVIFCRNVLIYFYPEMQKKIIANLANHISPGGYLFVGLSETAQNVEHDMIRIAPSVYKKQSSEKDRAGEKGERFR
jgi:chemotaxis protein methyltransferase CheR